MENMPPLRAAKPPRRDSNPYPRAAKPSLRAAMPSWKSARPGPPLRLQGDYRLQPPWRRFLGSRDGLLVTCEDLEPRIWQREALTSPFRGEQEFKAGDAE